MYGKILGPAAVVMTYTVIIIEKGSGDELKIVVLEKAIKGFRLSSKYELTSSKGIVICRKDEYYEVLVEYFVSPATADLRNATLDGGCGLSI